MSALLARIAVVAVVAALAATTVALAATRTIRVGDDWFVRPGSAPTVTVKRNTTVIWRFVGASPHDVEVVHGPVVFSSPTRTSGTYRRRMTRRGTYHLICSIHGEDQRMTLRVR